jgi:hypothetical protein
MIPSTCNCVIQQVNALATIAQAKAICQAQATAQYPTPTASPNRYDGC